MSEGRKPWYGDGKQPWDHILEAGWGPEFAAGNVLKYLRRTKQPEHSAESAVIYFTWLRDLAVNPGPHQPRAIVVMEHLLTKLLTTSEARYLILMATA